MTIRIAMKGLLSAALTVAVFAAIGASEASAGEPIGGLIVKGGKNPGGNMNKVVIELGKAEAWAYDPATGELAPAAPEPAGKQDGVPVPGIGIVVKKNPGGGASFVVPVKDGRGPMPEKMENGRYDLIIRIPQASLPGKPRPGKGVEITFALTKTPEGVVHAKGSGSPKQAGF